MCSACSTDHHCKLNSWTAIKKQWIQMERQASTIVWQLSIFFKFMHLILNLRFLIASQSFLLSVARLHVKLWNHSHFLLDRQCFQIVQTIDLHRQFQTNSSPIASPFPLPNACVPSPQLKIGDDSSIKGVSIRLALQTIRCQNLWRCQFQNCRVSKFETWSPCAVSTQNSYWKDWSKKKNQLNSCTFD